MSYEFKGLEQAAEDLNRIHSGLLGKLRSTISDAIQLGQILANVREHVGQGNYLSWLKANSAISQDTAERYRKVYEHADKIRSLRNLQEAYEQIETLEAQARAAEDRKARERVAAFNETGEKPEGWRRGTDDKLAQDEQAKSRLKAAQDRLAQEVAADQEDRRAAESAPIDFDAIRAMAAQSGEAVAKREAFKDRIRVSHEGKDDPFLDALIEYLEELPDDSRRIEACHNVVKVCKGIVSDLQKEAAK